MMLVSGDLKLLKDFKSIKIDNLIDNSNLCKKIIAETDNRHSRLTGDTVGIIDSPDLHESLDPASSMRAVPK